MKLLFKLMKVFISMALGAGIFLVLIATGIVEFKRPPRPIPKLSQNMRENEHLPVEAVPQVHPEEALEELIAQKDNELSGSERLDVKLYDNVLSYVEQLEGQAPDDVEGQLRHYLTDDVGLSAEAAERLIRMCFWKNFSTLSDKWSSDQWQQRLGEFQCELKLKAAGFKTLGIMLTQNAKDDAEAFAQQMIAQAKQAISVKDKQ